VGFFPVLIPRILTNPSRLSKQDAVSSYLPTAAVDRRSFHPSIFSPGAHVEELTAESSHEGPETSSVVDPIQDDARATQRGEEERLQDLLSCPFEGCNFSHIVDYTRGPVEGPWKDHIFKVHWPTGSRNWKICRVDECGISQNNRNSAWKHLAVHVPGFRVKCPFCTTYLSRGDRVGQHISQQHPGQKP